MNWEPHGDDLIVMTERVTEYLHFCVELLNNNTRIISVLKELLHKKKRPSRRETGEERLLRSVKRAESEAKEVYRKETAAKLQQNKMLNVW